MNRLTGYADDELADPGMRLLLVHPDDAAGTGTTRDLQYATILMNWDVTENFSIESITSSSTGGVTADNQGLARWTQMHIEPVLGDIDPYDHNIVVHTFPGQQDKVYSALLGDKSLLAGASLMAPAVLVVQTLRDEPLYQLNELECVGEQVWANVYRTDTIVRIDPRDGAVSGVLDLAGIIEPHPASADSSAVLNGIAWDEGAGTFLVTGKLWPELIEIRVTEPGVPIASMSRATASWLQAAKSKVWYCSFTTRAMPWSRDAAYGTTRSASIPSRTTRSRSSS